MLTPNRAVQERLVLGAAMPPRERNCGAARHDPRRCPSGRIVVATLSESTTTSISNAVVAASSFRKHARQPADSGPVLRLDPALFSARQQKHR